jgi:hypothetical protein
VDESFVSVFFSLSSAFADVDVEVRLIFGRMRRFCFEGGRISSRSTGTPRDTRKSRRILLRVQLGGCIGGGCTNCCQRDSDRSDRNAELLDESSGNTRAGSELEFGNMASR